LAHGSLFYSPLIGLPRGKSLLPVFPDGKEQLGLLFGEKISLQSPVSLLKGRKTAALLKVIDVLLFHARAEGKEVSHGMKIHEEVVAIARPHKQIILACLQLLVKKPALGIRANRQARKKTGEPSPRQGALKR